MKGFNHWVYIVLAVGMLMFAVPQLEVGGGFAVESLFAVIWLCFALLVIAAQLHEILGVEEETKRRLNQIKRARRWQTEQRLQRKAGFTRLQQ